MKNKGITLIALTITVIVLLIIAGITLSVGSNMIKKANLEKLKTDMLLIRTKGKEYVENANFKLGPNVDDAEDKEDKITNAKTELKGKELELTVTPLKDVMEYIKGYLQKVLSSMGLDVSFESQIREKQLKVKIYSDDNSLLIGHTGKNLSALQTIVRSVVKNKYGVTPYISLDVENYKDKQIMYLQKNILQNYKK